MSVAKTFAEHNQPSHPSVAVLERMDGFETLMEIYDILKTRRFESLYSIKRAFSSR